MMGQKFNDRTKFLAYFESAGEEQQTFRDCSHVRRVTFQLILRVLVGNEAP